MLTGKRHALLLLCHDDPEHLRLLIEALACSTVHFFVHVDLKFGISAFESLGERDDGTFIKSRVKVHWGGWSQVKATLNAIREARGSGIEFDRFSLLSGQHFPLRSRYDVFDYFDSKDAEFIDITRVPNAAANKTLLRFTRFFIEGAHRPVGVRQKILNRVYRLIRKFPLRSPKRGLGDWTIYAGTQWWTLSAQAIEVIERTLHERPNVAKFFRWVGCPDESFFQTILGNNGFLRRCVRSPTYTDWSNPSEAPCFIQLSHLTEILNPAYQLDGPYGNSAAIFARKFGSRNHDIVEHILMNISDLEALASLPGQPEAGDVSSESLSSSAQNS